MAEIKVLHLKDEPSTEVERAIVEDLKNQIISSFSDELMEYLREEPGEIIIYVEENLENMTIEILGFDITVEEQILESIKHIL